MATKVAHPLVISDEGESIPELIEGHESYKYYYGGMLGEYITVSAFRAKEGEPFKQCICEKCGDEGLYHDAHAWALDVPPDTDRWNVLLCEDCYESKVPEEEKSTYVKVLTQH